jgi:hypothetical protein
MAGVTTRDHASSDLDCRNASRRAVTRGAGWNGLDYLEVSDDQTRLDLYFLGPAPEGLTRANVRVSGGRRIPDVRVRDVAVVSSDDPRQDGYVRVTVDRPGDFSTYQICLVETDDRGRATDTPLRGFDPRYSCLDFTFKAGCPSDLDCAPVEGCPPPPDTRVEIDYLARDYERLRQLILDRLSLFVPDWRERHVPDVGVTLVELLAHVGDELSYFQDAVATEAYLATARRRVSVRRHARLVDYPMHEGCNARAWVCLAVDEEVQFDLDDILLIAAARHPGAGPLPWDDFVRLPESSRQVFEPVGSGSVVARPAHNTIRFYTWGDKDCCLVTGATSATLLDAWDDETPDDDTPDDDTPDNDTPDNETPDVETPDYEAPGYEPDDAAPEHETPVNQAPGHAAPGGPDQAVPYRPAGHRGEEAYGSGSPEERKRALDLHVGDVLVLEEVIGPRTGVPADADPARRHAVCLTAVHPTVDPVTRQPVVDVTWADADALPFPLCVSTGGPAPDCEPLHDVSVARGNVLLVDHGLTRDEPLGEVPVRSTEQKCGDACHPAQVVFAPGRFRPHLTAAPITMAAPVPPCPARDALRQDPRQARPQLAVDQVLVEAGLEPEPGVGHRWTPVGDLLGSSARDRHVVVEVDESGRGRLRFGDGENGRLPEARSRFHATYRVGNGPEGNVGPGAINGLVTRGTAIDGLAVRVRNPLAAAGGVAPEHVDEIRLLAPHAFRRVLARAITPADYAAIVERDFPQVQRASAVARFTGSHTEMLIAVDQRGTSEADPELLDRIARHLERYRRIGHDVVVAGARAVPLDLQVVVCVDPAYVSAPVAAAVRAALGARRNADSSLGLFHPNRLTFGSGVHVSDVVAAVQRLDGVENVVVRALHRLFEGPAGELEQGVLTLGPLEIARLDNDPSLPEHGVLTIELRGGR